MFRSLGGLLLALLVGLPTAGSASAQAVPTTVAERADFEVVTPYDSMRVFLERVQAGTPELRLGTFARSHEGRDLPYAIFSRPAVTTPEEARALGRTVLVLAANVHGGERTLRESLLLLVRDLATPGSPMNAVLDDLTILVVPQLNPDGFSAVPPTRGNARGLDLNRDYMKLEQPEIRGYVREILLRWRPHLFVDGHDGGSYPYNLNYQCPSHPGADLRLTALCDDHLFPAIDAALDAEGYRSWYYTGGTETRWEVGGTDPRIGRNYGGLANMVGVLFESPGGQPREAAVRSGQLAFETVLLWARTHAGALEAAVRAAHEETIALGAEPRGEIPIEVEYAPEDRQVEYLIAQGAGEARRVVTVQSDSLMKHPVPTLARPRPWGYLLPREAEGAVELLRLHGIRVERLREATTLTVDAYTITEITHERAYDHPAATRIEVGETVTTEVEMPVGSFLVRLDQGQGRVAAQLLEPESRDGVVYWNRMDPWLPRREVEEARAGNGRPPQVPIYKVMAPVALPVELVPDL